MHSPWRQMCPLIVLDALQHELLITKSGSIIEKDTGEYEQGSSLSHISHIWVFLDLKLGKWFPCTWAFWTRILGCYKKHVPKPSRFPWFCTLVLALKVPCPRKALHPRQIGTTGQPHWTRRRMERQGELWACLREKTSGHSGVKKKRHLRWHPGSWEWGLVNERPTEWERGHRGGRDEIKTAAKTHAALTWPCTLLGALPITTTQSSQQPDKVGTIIFVLQIMRPRHRKLEGLG